MHRIHTACHISLAVQQFLVMKQIIAVPNCEWLLSLTETQELTQFIVSLQYVEFNRKQQQVQQPSQIGLPEVLRPYSCSMCVCVWVTGLGFVYIMLCTDYVEVTGNPLSLMHFSVQGNTDLWVRVKKLNPELWISKLLHEGLSGYLWFTALIMILTNIWHKWQSNTPVYYNLLLGLHVSTPWSHPQALHWTYLSLSNS
jgi:hypothetical protein